MTVTLHLPPEVEESLSTQAKANGLSLEEYAAQVLRDKSQVSADSLAHAAEKAAAFEGWARSHPRRRPLPADALQRENSIRSPR
jgi:hypothetical protein